MKKQLKKLKPGMVINKGARPSDIDPIVESDDVYRCSCCGHKYKKQDGNFNVSKSPIFHGNNGYLTICKKCIAALYEKYIDFFDKDEDAAMERICQITDMYVDDAAWDSSRIGASDKTRMGKYIQKLNLAQSNGTTYSDTLIRRFEEERVREEEERVREEEERARIEQEAAQVPPADETDNIPDEVKHRFGPGFSANDYEVLQYEYDDWAEKYGKAIDKRQEELYVSICYMKLSLRQGIQSGLQGVGTLANSYKSFIEAATTEIEDRKRREEAQTELKPLGVWIREIEAHTPAEYFKDKKIYSDYDGLKEYIGRFMLRPLRNLLTGSKDMDKEFNLSGTER